MNGLSSVINKKTALQFILLMILSVFTVLVSGIIKFGGVPEYSAFGYIIRTGFMFIMFAAMWVIPEFLNKLSGIPLFGICCWNRKSIFITAAILFAFRIPYLIAFFPGVSNFDAITQLHDFFNGMNPVLVGQKEIMVLLDDRHPVFDTIVFGGLASIGKAVHNMNLGFFLFTFLQTTLCAIGFAMILCYMEKLKVPHIYRLLGFLFLALSPFIGLFMMSMMKDAFFGMFFIFYFLVYVKICLEEDSDNKGGWIALIVLSIFLALSRKAGVYQAILYNVGLLLSANARKNLKLLVVSIAAPAIVIFVLLQGIIFPATHIISGGAFFRQEKYGFLIQQTAKAVLDHPDEISDEDRQIINNVCDYELIDDHYDLNSIDPIKGIFRGEEVSDEDINAFLGLYARYAIKYPVSYLLAYFGVNGFYFSPKATIGVFQGVMENDLGIYNPESLSAIKDKIMGLSEKLMFNGKNLFFNMAMYVFWIPVISLFRIIYYGKKERMCALIPIFINILFLSFCPVALDRYAICQFYVAPLVFGLGACYDC